MTILLTFADANECEENAEACDLNADCTNTVGSWTCSCKTGYSGDGFYCTSMYWDVSIIVIVIILLCADAFILEGNIENDN